MAALVDVATAAAVPAVAAGRVARAARIAFVAPEAATRERPQAPFRLVAQDAVAAPAPDPDAAPRVLAHVPVAAAAEAARLAAGQVASQNPGLARARVAPADGLQVGLGVAARVGARAPRRPPVPSEGGHDPKNRAGRVVSGAQVHGPPSLRVVVASVDEQAPPVARSAGAYPLNPSVVRRASVRLARTAPECEMVAAACGPRPPGRVAREAARPTRTFAVAQVPDAKAARLGGPITDPLRASGVAAALRPFGLRQN